MSIDQLDWRGLRGVVLHRDDYTCQICEVAAATEVDHIWPRALGGDDGLDNLRAACKPCNAAKGDTTYVKFFTAARANAAQRTMLADAVASIWNAAMWRTVEHALADGASGDEAADIADGPTSDEHLQAVIDAVVFWLNRKNESEIVATERVS